jgi:hypothetical protein
VRCSSRLAVIAMLVVSLAAKPRMTRAECDPAMHIEPIASRFEIHGDTVYDKNANLTWMRCSYGQEWPKPRAVMARSSFSTGTAQGVCTGRATRPGGFRSETNCKASGRPAARSRHSTKRCFQGPRRSSIGRAPQPARPMLGWCSSGPEWRRGTFSRPHHSRCAWCEPVGSRSVTLSHPIFLPEPNWISLLSFPERRPGHTILPSASNMSCRSCGRDRR